jgi:hypothetical protein
MNMNQHEPITAALATEWLCELEMHYASRTFEGAVTRHITMAYIGIGDWVVRVRKTGSNGSITETLYRGTDIDTAVEAFNNQL